MPTKTNVDGVEETKWIGLKWSPLSSLEKRLAAVPDLPDEAAEALATLACLCAEYPGDLLREQSEHARALCRAADILSLLSGAGATIEDSSAFEGAGTPGFVDSLILRSLSADELRRLAANIRLPLKVSVDVGSIASTKDRSRRRMAFTLRRAVEGDPTLSATFALLGHSLLANYGLGAGRKRGRSASEIMGQAMDLLNPSTKGMKARDVASVDNAVRDAGRKWKHRDLLGKTRELVINFRLAFKGELGVFVDEERWNAWTPNVGLPTSSRRRAVSRSSSPLDPGRARAGQGAQP